MSTFSPLSRWSSTRLQSSFAALISVSLLAAGLLVVDAQAAHAEGSGSPAAIAAEVPPTPPETSFGFAIVPDTQNEVMVDGTPQLNSRYQWLSDNKDALNLKFIAHTGDLVNWGVADPIQFTRASSATNILDNSGVPYAYAIGNHDGAAVKVGGSAAPGSVRTNLRNTTLFNQNFPLTRFSNVQGTFEPDKVDNMFQTFTAGGVDWLVLTHEMWPRESVIQWMKSVVSSHPTYNVIVNTHAYANQAGDLPTTGNYGDQNAQVEWDEFTSQYPNIKFVVSGHYGASTTPVINAGYNYSERTGVNGNKVALIMTAYHSSYQNHVRLLNIDTASGTINSSVYVSRSTSTAYATGYITDGASNFVTTGMNWIQPDGTSPPPVLTVPSAPGGVVAAAGDGRAAVTFTAPSSNGGSPVTSYTATSSPGGFTASGATSPITVPGLVNGTSYSFTVSASNVVGASAQSLPSTSVVPSIAAQSVELLADPGFETGVGGWKPFSVGTITSVTSPVHGGLKAIKVAAVASTANLVGLTQNSVIPSTVLGKQYTAQCWVNPSSAGLSVQIRLLQYAPTTSVNTKLASTVVASVPANTWSLMKVYGSATQDGYRIIPQIYSTNQTTNTGSIVYDDCSVAAAGEAVLSAPGAPTAVTATAGDGMASVSFTAPASNGGADITGYTVTSTPGSLTASGSTSPIVVGGLTNGTSYAFTVQAINAVGASTASVATNSVTPVEPPSVTVPSAPGPVVAVPGDARAAVSFAAPVSNGGSPVTSYTVTSSPGGFTAMGTASPVTVAGLSNSTPYTFTVSASNVVGPSVQSAASAPVVPQPAAQIAELLTDPGFELGTGGWKAFSVGTITSVNSPVHGGVKAIRVTPVATTTNLVGLTQNSVIPSTVLGKQYTAQCWVNPSSAGLSVQIRLLQYAPTTSVNTKLASTVAASLPANTWSLMKVTGTATQDGYRIIPQIYSTNQTTKTGSIVYDDCSVAAG